jgi:hypothetical protein
MIALGYLGNPSSAYSQARISAKAPVVAQQSASNQNRILSRNQENSVTGDGVLLKDFIYNFNLKQGSKISLDSAFGLYAQKGNVSYEVVEGREGLKGVLSYLRQNKNPTEKEKASINYIEGLLKRTWEGNKNSVNALERAVQDRVIDVTKEAGNVMGGRYVLKVISPTVGEAKGNTVYAIVDLKNDFYAPGKNVPLATKPVQSQKDSLAKVAKARAAKARQKFVKDSTEKETARQKAMRDDLTLERYKIDSLNQVSAQRAERQKYVTDSTKEAIAREQFVRDSTQAYSDSVSNARNRFVKDSVEEVKAVEREKFVADSITKAIASRKQRTRFGVEAAYGMRNEVVVGAFAEVPFNSGLSAEFYTNYHVKRGDADTTEIKPDTAFRERQLIGPGTYKQRVDETLTTSEKRALAEAGLGLILRTGNVTFNFRGGANVSSQRDTVDGKSTISFERNMLPLGLTEVITNSKGVNKKNLIQPAFSAGVFYDINKDWALGITYNMIGSDNVQRINLRWRF